MELLRSKKTLAIFLVLLSLFLYLLHYLIFNDFHHIALFGLHELAFLPIEVLIVSLILEKIIEEINKTEQRSKTKMIIGAFLSEVGIKLLSLIAENLSDEEKTAINSKLESLDRTAKTKSDDQKLLAEIKIKADRKSLDKLKNFLIEKRHFLIGIFESPSLSLDESFTNLIFAVLHLADELSYRENFESLPEEDIDHLNGDLRRCFEALFFEWLNYLRFAKEKYPYLYSLYMRTNPFSKTSVIVS